MLLLGDGWRRLAPTAILLSILTCAACGGTQASSQRGRHVAVQLPALEGGEIKSAAYRGQPVLLHVFSTWDPALSFDVELLRSLHEDYGEELRIIGIALNPEGYSIVAPWKRAMQIDYLIALGDDALRAGKSPLGRLERQLTTLLLDRKGRLVRRWNGPLDEKSLREQVRSLVQQ